MNACAAVLAARVRTLLQYRAAAMAGVGTRLFWGLIRVMIFEAFYRSSTAAQPMELPDVVDYVWLGQATLALMPAIAVVDVDVRAMVRNGTVAYELLRPVDLYGLWYSRAAAARLAPTLLQAPLVLLAAFLLFGMRPPPSLASGAAWAAATLGALLLSAAITALVTVSLLWTVSAEGVSRLVPALAFLCSGMLAPLPLFPDGARAVLEFLPFAATADVPFRLYAGHLPPGALLPALAHQLAWTAALVLLGRWLLARGARRLVVQGG